MRPMLDDIELPQVREVVTWDRRALAEHRAPGMDGSVLQNLGREATVVVVSGVATGSDTASFVARLEDRLRAGAPVPFVADITADARIERVVIADLSVEELAGRPQRIRYTLALREDRRPPSPPRADLSADILADAEGVMAGLVAGLGASAEVIADLTEFADTMSDLLERLHRFRAAIEASR